MGLARLRREEGPSLVTGSLQTELQEMRVGSLPPAEKTPARCSGARPGGLALTPCASYDIRSRRSAELSVFPSIAPNLGFPLRPKPVLP